METNDYRDIPELFDAKFAQKRFGFSRCMVYELLNKQACGIVSIGRRKFFHRDTFLHWLKEQAGGAA